LFRFLLAAAHLRSLASPESGQSSAWFFYWICFPIILIPVFWSPRLILFFCSCFLSQRLFCFFIFPRARCRKPCAGPVFFAQVSRSGIPIPAGRCAGRVHCPCLISFFCVVLLLLVHSTSHRSDSSARPLLPRRTQSSSCSIFSGVSSQSVFWLLFPATLGLASSSLRYCVWSRWFCFCPAHAEVSIWTPVAVSDSVLKQDIFVAACVALDVCR
jgi:hypothetical protein